MYGPGRAGETWTGGLAPPPQGTSWRGEGGASSRAAPSCLIDCPGRRSVRRLLGAGSGRVVAPPPTVAAAQGLARSLHKGRFDCPNCINTTPHPQHTTTSACAYTAVRTGVVADSPLHLARADQPQQAPTPGLPSKNLCWPEWRGPPTPLSLQCNPRGPWLRRGSSLWPCWRPCRSVVPSTTPVEFWFAP